MPRDFKAEAGPTSPPSQAGQISPPPQVAVKKKVLVYSVYRNDTIVLQVDKYEVVGKDADSGRDILQTRKCHREAQFVNHRAWVTEEDMLRLRSRSGYGCDFMEATPCEGIVYGSVRGRPWEAVCMEYLWNGWRQESPTARAANKNKARGFVSNMIRNTRIVTGKLKSIQRDPFGEGDIIDELARLKSGELKPPEEMVAEAELAAVA